MPNIRAVAPPDRSWLGSGADGTTLALDRPRPIRLQRLGLHQFRNIASLELALMEPRLLVIGRNGEGKSNLLEAVELLTSLRSHRCSHDRDLIRHGNDGSRLRAGDDEGDGGELRLRRSGVRLALRSVTDTDAPVRGLRTLWHPTG